MPRLLGERVMLREYKADDIGDIRKWVNDAETTRYLSTRFWPPQTMVDSEEFLSRMLQSSHSAYNFVIADRGDERYIGQLDMFQVDWRLRCGELGMVIGSASDRGQGLGRGTGADEALCFPHAGPGAAGDGGPYGKPRRAQVLPESRLRDGRREAPCVFYRRTLLRCGHSQHTQGRIRGPRMTPRAADPHIVNHPGPKGPGMVFCHAAGNGTRD